MEATNNTPLIQKYSLSKVGDFWQVHNNVDQTTVFVSEQKGLAQNTLIRLRQGVMDETDLNPHKREKRRDCLKNHYVKPVT